MCYYVGFGLFSAAMATSLYFLIYNNTTWNPYAVWIAAFSLTTFVVWGLDKLLSKTMTTRTPEFILHALAVLGGFPGGWLGMFLFRHKINVQKHPWFWIVLVLSTIGHGLLTYYWFVMGR